MQKVEKSFLNNEVLSFTRCVLTIFKGDEPNSRTQTVTDLMSRRKSVNYAVGHFGNYLVLDDDLLSLKGKNWLTDRVCRSSTYKYIIGLFSRYYTQNCLSNNINSYAP